MTNATESAGDPSLFRIFGSKPGAYGAGILGVLDERNWETVHDLAEVYTSWGGYAYSRQDFGVTARNEFQNPLRPDRHRREEPGQPGARRLRQ